MYYVLSLAWPLELIHPLSLSLSVATRTDPTTPPPSLSLDGYGYDVVA